MGLVVQVVIALNLFVAQAVLPSDLDPTAKAWITAGTLLASVMLAVIYLRQQRKPGAQGDS